MIGYNSLSVHFPIFWGGVTILSEKVGGFIMLFSVFKNTERFIWTNHSVQKMKFYGLSKSRVKGVINRPQRIEEGVAPKTIAVMQRVNHRAKIFSAGVKSKKRLTEIWIMYQCVSTEGKTKNSKLRTSGQFKVISAWRYPGISPTTGKIPIPLEILEELDNLI